MNITKNLIMSKKYFLSIAVLFLLAQNAVSQFGVHAGLSIANMTIQYDEFGETEKERFGIRPGFLIGGFYRHQIKSNFAIQPELNFVQRGGREAYEFFGESIESEFILNYLELPVNFLYTSSEFGGFYIGAGPSFNFGLSGKAKLTYEGETESDNVNFGKDEDIKGFFIGANILAGFQFENGFNISTFFTQSITNSAPQSEIDEENAKTGFMNYGLRLGYTFGNSGMGKANTKIKLKQIY